MCGGSNLMQEVFKRKEDEIAQEIADYIKSTYNQHYVNEEENKDVIDDWDEMGIVTEACLSNVVKYAKRYGKKAGKNRKDLLKAAHYLIVAMYFEEDKENNT